MSEESESFLISEQLKSNFEFSCDFLKWTFESHRKGEFWLQFELIVKLKAFKQSKWVVINYKRIRSISKFKIKRSTSSNFHHDLKYIAMKNKLKEKKVQSCN